MSRKGETVTLSLSVQEKERLENLAELFGCMRGDKANISQLMRAIAAGDLKISWADSRSPFTDEQVNSLKIAQQTITNVLLLME